MVAFIIGFASGTVFGTVIMAAMSAASWDDREREYRSIYIERKDSRQHEHESD